jgi:hypothetical protein
MYSGRSGRHTLFATLPLLSVLALLAVLAQGCGAPAGPAATPTRTTERYVARIAPLNGSAVSGVVNLQVTGATLLVTIDVTGLEPGRRHFQHVHGEPGVPAACPTAADANAREVVTLTEAMTRIGPLAFDIQPYPLPDEHGALRWSRTFTLEAQELQATAPWSEHVVVFHGMTRNGTYDQLLPVACGLIQPA